MRILVLSDLPQFVTGGAEKQAANLIEAWLDAGHEVSCFGRRMGRGPVVMGKHQLPVHRIHTIQRFGRLMRALSYGLSLSFLLLRYGNRFDVVYTRFLGEAAATASLLKRLHLLRVVLVSTPANTGGTGDANFLRRLPFSRALIRLLDVQCDGINLIAPAMIEELRGIGFSGKNFSTIPNGVVTRSEPPDHRQRSKRFLSVGRLARQKGYDGLIDAMALIKDRLEPGLVRIIGDGPERVVLQARAEREGVEFAIEWLGELEHEAVLAELERSQVFLLPSRYEGMSNAGLEAMERGLAMLMTRCGGLDTFVKSEMGWVVEPENVGALADAMSQAIAKSPLQLAEMGELNRVFVLKHCGLTVVAERYLDLFERLCASRRRSHAA